MNILKYIFKKVYWKGYIDGVRSRLESTKTKIYKTSKSKRTRELKRYYQNKLKEIK